MSENEEANVVGSGKRRRWLLPATGFATAVLLVGGVWAVATAFESPGQRAASARPPAPGPLLAEVRSGALQRTVSTAATIALERDQSVPIVGAASPGDTPAAAINVVTAESAAGAEITAGDVVLEVNGRPRIATSGAFRYYRDLSPGVSGPDVRQLQAFLGLSVDGRFGASTEKALRALYAKAGYEPVSVVPTTAESAPGSDAKAESVSPLAPVLVVPASELLVFERFPSYVVAAPAVGDLPSDATLTVESGGFIARADVPLSFARSMSADLPVTIEHEETSIAGRVSGIVDTPERPANSGGGAPSESQTPADQKRVQFVLAPDAPVDFSWRGGEVVVKAVVTTAAENALIVPSIAVVTGRGGSAYVRKRERDGSFVSVPVNELATLDGKSAIAPHDDGSLSAGDRVRTG